MDVTIDEVDPLDPANEPLLHAMYDVSAAARADRPFEIWAPWTTTRATWTSRRDDEEQVFWAASVGARVVGMAHLFLPTYDNLHLAMADLFVHPDSRRRGIGTTLLATTRERCQAAGRTVLMTTPYSPVDRPGPGESFLSARGFELGIAEMSRVCDLAETEHTWPALAAKAAPHHADYRLETWDDRVPEHLVDSYCEVTRVFSEEAPTGELEWEPEVWTPDRVTKRDDMFQRTGRHQFGVLAFAADGTCVAGTEMMVNRAASWRALQGSTIVLPGHRGHRLGIAVKLANHAAVRKAYPDCRYAFTTNAGVNAPMNAVNELLGFRDVERQLEMQLRL